VNTKTHIRGDNNVDTTKELPTVISFCSGYGGIERGLDLSGLEHRVIAYVEIEAYAIANLVAKMETGKLPPCPIYTDIKTFPSHIFRGKADIITGGYPCQPFSLSGSRKGEDDERHIWKHIRRHTQAIRPAKCFFENVQGHISLGLNTVISDLEEDGYRTAWGIFSANEVGAPHERKRVFILSDSNSIGLQEHGHKQSNDAIESSQVGNANSAHGERGRIPGGVDKEHPITHSASTSLGEQTTQQWESEPRLGRVANGCANRVDRLRLLGNGVVPHTAAKAWKTLNERINNG
jgi:DNA (cytosine-5)-methyltransferase 1